MRAEPAGGGRKLFSHFRSVQETSSLLRNLKGSRPAAPAKGCSPLGE
jgi:hypothetical protein